MCISYFIIVIKFVIKLESFYCVDYKAIFVFFCPLAVINLIVNDISDLL